MKKIIAICSLLLATLAFSVEAASVATKSFKEKRGKAIKDHDGNDWPDWGKLD